MIMTLNSGKADRWITGQGGIVERASGATITLDGSPVFTDGYMLSSGTCGMTVGVTSRSVATGFSFGGNCLIPPTNEDYDMLFAVGGSGNAYYITQAAASIAVGHWGWSLIGTSLASLRDGKIHSFICTVGTNSVKLYIDSILHLSDTRTNITPSAFFRVGYLEAGGYICNTGGKFGNCRFWTKTLSQAEVKLLHFRRGNVCG